MADACANTAQSARQGMPTHTPPFAETHSAVCGVEPFLARKGVHRKGA